MSTKPKSSIRARITVTPETRFVCPCCGKSFALGDVPMGQLPAGIRPQFERSMGLDLTAEPDEMED